MPTRSKTAARAKGGNLPAKLLLYAAVLGGLYALWFFVMYRVYPDHLMFTAPDLPKLLPPTLRALFPETDVGVAATSAARYAIYVNRDAAWRFCLTVVQGLGVIVMLVVQLLWKTHVRRRCIPLARQGKRAVSSYRAAMVLLLLLEGALAYVTWCMGVSAIEGRTVWDLVTAFAIYPASFAGGVLLCRLGAPACISAKHGYFVRL